MSLSGNGKQCAGSGRDRTEKAVLPLHCVRAASATDHRRLICPRSRTAPLAADVVIIE
jgi:hypothetical protein